MISREGVMSRFSIQFLFWTMLTQALGFVGAHFAYQISDNAFISVSVGIIVIITATVLLNLGRLPCSWKVLNCLFPVAAASIIYIQVPSWYFFLAFLLFALVHLPAVWTRVPYYPTPVSAYEYVLGLLPHEKNFKFLDVGSGTGSLIHFLALRSPTGDFVGIEISLLPYLVSKIKNRSLKNVEIRFQNLWKTDFSTFEVIYAFLSPVPMNDLWTKFKAEGKSNALLISNSFEAPIEANNVIESGEARGSTLYLYYRE